MSFELFIGGRYFKSRNRNAFISLTTFLSTAGVAMGVMVMIVVIAVMSGAEIELRNRMLGVTAHIVVMGHGGGIDHHRDAAETIRTVPGVAAATPYLYTQAMLRSPEGINGAVLRGIDPDTVGEVIRTLKPETLDGLRRPEAEDADLPRIPGIVLGRELAASLKAGPGDQISLTIPGGSTGYVSRVPAIKRFQVTAVYESGLYEFDKALAFIRLEEAQNILRIGDRVSGIEVRVDDIYGANEIGEEIVQRLGFGYGFQDWIQANRNLFSALRLQKTVMFIILVLIVLVAAFNIASSLIMMVMEKRKDIAILKAMGAADRHIRRIFVYKGMVIGAAGTAIGVVTGVAVCLLLKRYKFIELPYDVYFFPTLPVSLEWLDVALIVGATLLICFFSTLYPARKASRLHPAEILR